MVDRSRVLEEATRVRRALEETKDELPDVCLQEFPRGACGDASLILARVLVDTGVCALTDVRYVTGDRGHMADGSWCSHAWLVVGGHIVDITADQFEEGAPGVWMPIDASWHEQFTQDPTQSGTPSVRFSDSSESALLRSYLTVAEAARRM